MAEVKSNQNVKVNREKIMEALRDRKPYAFRLPIALRLAINRTTSEDASNFVIELLLQNEDVKKNFLEIVEEGYNRAERKPKSDIAKLIDLI